MAATFDGPPRSFDLDRFQVEAMDHLDAGRSVVVSAPTGSGKTWVAEYAIARAASQGRRGLYTTPIKALSNQKFRDLRGWMGRDNVGLLTGDNSINGDASAVVMTTEVLRNMLYSQPERLDSTDVVVMDEVHYLQDNYRGPVWEEVIIHLPSHIRLVALSATVSNADELAEWISSVHGPCEAVTETTRPVRLQNNYLIGEKKSGRLHLLPTLRKGRSNPEGRKYDPQRSGGRDKRRNGPPQRRPWRTPRRPEVITELRRRNLLPAITFIFSRAGCEDAVDAVRTAGIRLTDDAEAQRITEHVMLRTGHLSETDRTALRWDTWLAGLQAGVAAHHARIVPLFKETVEELFTMGLLRAVFATETLALGINMPARTVVIEKLSKFTGEHHETLSPGDYTQLTGRAGRRGIDDEGHAVVLWTPFTTFDEVSGLAKSRAFELRSAFRPTYNMTCHLVERYTRKEAEELMSRSFGQFQANRAIESLLERRAVLEKRLGQTTEEGLASADRSEIDDALSRLRPGDAIDVGRVVAVLSVSWRRRAVKVEVLDRDGEPHTLDADALTEPPLVVKSLRLPEPFNPHSRSHQHDLVGQLRSLKRRANRTKASAPTAPEPSTSPWRNEETTQTRRELKRVNARIARRRGQLAERFGSVVALLTELGHIDKWTLTERGSILLGTFHELDLVLVESLLAGHLDDHDPATLAGLVSAFVHERRRNDDPPPEWYSTPAAEASMRGIETTLARIQRLESAHGLPESRDIDPSLFAATHGWAAGGGLGDILDEEDLSGGDFVRSMKQVLDLVSQVAVVAPNPGTRRAAAAAVDMMQRGIVDAPMEEDDAETTDGADG